VNTYVAGSGIRIEFATLSGQGGRDYNEDACGYWTSDGGACFIVCDGAGGHGGGDVASETAVRTLLSAYSTMPELSRQNIERIITQTDVAIRYGQQLAGGLRKMSATVAALFFDGSAQKAQWSNLGDTRLYLVRKRHCRQLTKDHSVVQTFVDAGVISESEIRNHAKRNLLFAALGMGDGVPPAALETAFDIDDGDAFLICTDGFWEVVLETEMVECLTRADSAEEWLLQMEQLIQLRGTPLQDNYSALAVWVGRPNEITMPWPDQAAVAELVAETSPGPA
jgi:serine/threonine protein phosphatase PrpC